MKAQSVAGLLRVGDAFARHGWVTHGEPSAMKIYLYALHLARYQGSREGLLQVAERLSRIGQTALAEAASRAAEDLGASQAAATEADASEDDQPLALARPDLLK